MAESFESGTILRYPYLWRRQQDEGRSNAEKDRPVCLALVMRDEAKDLTHLVLLAISGTPPYPEQRALEVPPLEIKRAGLSLFKQAWITVGEYNYDIAERSFFLEPRQRRKGRFSAAFLNTIWKELHVSFRLGNARVDRTL